MLHFKVKNQILGRPTSSHSALLKSPFLSWILLNMGKNTRSLADVKRSSKISNRILRGREVAEVEVTEKVR